MNMIGVIWKNRAIVSAFCFFVWLASAAAQSVDNSVTNQSGAQPAENTGTNQASEAGFSTNAGAILPPVVLPAYGAQPVPNVFEAQNNVPLMAGPSALGGGGFGSPQTGTSVLGGPGFAAPTGRGLYQAGNLVVHAGLSYSYLYGTGIEAAPGQHSSVSDQTVSPNLTVYLGNHWTLGYSAAISTYSGDSSLSDSTGQSVSLAWSTIYDDWGLGLSQGYSVSDTPLIQTGTQTEEDSYVTALSVTRQLGGNFSFAGGLNQSFVYASQFTDVRDWSANGALNYQLTPKLQFGANIGGGFDESSGSPTLTDESYQGILMFHPGIKTTINLSAGLEEESFDSSSVPSSSTPIFSASVMYQVLRNTSISISAGRSISPSFFSNQVSTATSVSVILQQNLSAKLSLSLSGGYGEDSYQAIQPAPLPIHFLGTATTTPLEVTRTDNTTYLGASLSYAVLSRLSGSLSYSYSRNSSSQGEFSYSSSQFSVSVRYEY
jgi:hypothetical protein